MIIYSFHAILPSRKQEEEARRTKKKRGPKPKYLGVPIPNVNTMGRKGWRMWSPMAPTKPAVPGKPGSFYAVIGARPFLVVRASPSSIFAAPRREPLWACGCWPRVRDSGVLRASWRSRSIPSGGGWRWRPWQVTDTLFRDLKLSQVQVMSFRAYP